MQNSKGVGSAETENHTLNLLNFSTFGTLKNSSFMESFFI